MTKLYEELKKALKEEEDNIVAEFNASAEVGDFVQLGDKMGVLVYAPYQKCYAVAPIDNLDQLIELDSAGILRIVNYKKDFSKIAEQLREKALTKHQTQFLRANWN